MAEIRLTRKPKVEEVEEIVRAEPGDLMLILTHHKGPLTRLGVFKEYTQTESETSRRKSVRRHVTLRQIYTLHEPEVLGEVMVPLITASRYQEETINVSREKTLIVVGQSEIVDFLRKSEDLHDYAPYVERMKKPYIEEVLEETPGEE